MLKFDFNFLSPINSNLVKYLDIAQNSIAIDPHNTMSKVRACMEFISIDIISKHNTDTKKPEKIGTLNDNINKLKKIGVIDSKSQSACDVARHACNEVIHSLEADSEWAQLCLSHMDIFCRWYAKRYYNIETRKEILILDNTGPMQKHTVKIKYEEAKQAYSNLDTDINGSDDVLLVLASANLLNAYVKQDDAILLIKPKYKFKQILIEKLEEIIRKQIEGVDIYFTKDTTYVKIYDLQFSFNYLVANQFMTSYMNSKYNKVQQWSGIRLQACARIVFKRAMEHTLQGGDFGD